MGISKMNSKAFLIKIIILIFTFHIIVIIDCQAKKDFKKVFEDRFPNYIVLNYRKGNFTNSKLDEYVVFFKEIKKYQASPSNTPKALKEAYKRDYEEMSQRDDIKKGLVVIIKGNKIILTMSNHFKETFPKFQELIEISIPQYKDKSYEKSPRRHLLLLPR